MLQVGNFVEVSTGMTDQHVRRVPRVVREEVTRKQVNRHLASGAVDHLNPEEILDRDVVITVMRAVRAIGSADLAVEGSEELVGRRAVGHEVQVLDLFADDPGRHGIDVESQDITADAVGLDQRRAPAHERVGDDPAREIVGPEESIFQRPIAELGEDQAAEQGPRAPGEPLMDGDDRPVILLDLLLLEGQGSDQCDVEIALDTHCDYRFPLHRAGLPADQRPGHSIILYTFCQHNACGSSLVIGADSRGIGRPRWPRAVADSPGIARRPSVPAQAAWPATSMSCSARASASRSAAITEE